MGAYLFRCGVDSLFLLPHNPSLQVFNWFSRFAKNRNKGTRILWWVLLLTVATGVAATVVWLVDGGHTPLGGIHGKIGFLMVLAGIIHAAGHISLGVRW